MSRNKTNEYLSSECLLTLVLLAVYSFSVCFNIHITRQEIRRAGLSVQLALDKLEPLQGLLSKWIFEPEEALNTTSSASEKLQYALRDLLSTADSVFVELKAVLQ
ncbi:hypothetical protein Bpfe_009356 [Biomphalaria pfeifferi]|uniref:Transmembrane protein n=1 Tax=Biomphalaria pfeifferi TaxID=112525 RepID=A0AAD8BV21_BIOPF|nr:hypothetical protein Bpfe_009356 [Biomphalaria pfeifferi]